MHDPADPSEEPNGRPSTAATDADADVGETSADAETGESGAESPSSGASFDAEADDPTNGTVTRRRTLTALVGLGLVGGGSAATRGTGAGDGVAPADVVRSDGSWRVDVDGERGIRLDPAGTVTLDGERYTGSGNAVVGHLNDVAEGVVGGTVGGGGVFDHDDGEAEGNVVDGHFGTVGGGVDNRVGGSAPDGAIAGTIGGGWGNEVSGSAATVAGGARNEAPGLRASVGGGINNRATGTATAVSGGTGNYGSGTYSTVAGGGGNAADGQYTTVGGGRGNRATAEAATIGGGRRNRAGGRRSTVAGGYYNEADGYGSVVPGGKGNEADGDFSVAVGQGAHAGGHDGAYVFADSSETAFEATADDAAFFQMPVHARAFNTTSSRATKTDLRSVDHEETLAKVRSIDVRTWAFEDGDDGRHIGPTAEDFHETFGFGASDEAIATVDADGVALSAIQGLAAQLDAVRDRLDDARDRIESLESRIDELESRAAGDERTESTSGPDGGS